ncbi:hypothetical protein ACFLS1_09295 [Verrucomicrobiota bacterium]
MITFRKMRSIICVLAICLAGCVAVPSDRSSDVAVTSDGKISAGGRIVEIDQLPRRLKSMGIKVNDSVTILIREDTSPSTLTEISRVLASAGYGRIMFSKPKRTIAVAKPSSKK